jgi:hypothetical protein
MPFLTIYWKDLWAVHFGGDRARLHGHTAAELECFDRRLAAMRVRDEAARYGRRQPIYRA